MSKMTDWTPEKRFQAALDTARAALKESQTIYDNETQSIGVVYAELDNTRSALRNICRYLTRSETWSAVPHPDFETLAIWDMEPTTGRDGR